MQKEKLINGFFRSFIEQMYTYGRLCAGGSGSSWRAGMMYQQSCAVSDHLPPSTVTKCTAGKAVREGDTKMVVAAIAKGCEKTQDLELGQATWGKGRSHSRKAGDQGMCRRQWAVWPGCTGASRLDFT